MHYSIAIIGSSGAIGQAIAQHISKTLPDITLHTFSRHAFTPLQPYWHHYFIDYLNEKTLQQAAQQASSSNPFDLVIVATGMLHDKTIQPEKSMKDLNLEQLQQLFAVNTIAPTLIAKHFLPYMAKDKRTVFAMLSARVGSISDNHTGGWYSYRASKSALNMMVKNFSIEMQRTHKQAIVVGLHPGTVDSPLSKPFQGFVPKDKLFSPETSAQHLFHVITQLKHQDSGLCFAWDGQEISP